MPRSIVVLMTGIIALNVATAQAQQTDAPWKGENLQYFPKDISRERLIQRMREFSFALDVRCQYCHAGGNGISFEGVSFPSDEKPAKTTARAMLRMVEMLNTTTLVQLPTRAEPRVVVDCATCHHGLAVPRSLQTTLFEIVAKDGAAAAVAKYRELRKDALLGRYNFGEWEINELARRLSEAGNTDAAISILEMNGEFNPGSADIDVMIGELHRRRGETDKAMERFRAALKKAPQNTVAKQRLAELEKKQE
jgi:tetratricopeptide (TPR) repeat protein